jgi:predicted component of type VI protein secretion system
MAASASVKLIMRQGPRPNETYDLDKDVYTLGREAGNDIVIEDTQISRHHARLTRQGNSYSVEDLGSTNGTFVNGSRVTGAVMLSNGDLLGLADTVVLAVQVPMVASDATVVSPSAGAGSTMVSGQPPTQPSFAPPPQPAPVQRQPARPAAPPPQQPAYAPPPPPYAPAQQAGARDNRRLILIGCGCLALLVVVAVIGMVAWSFIDCGSFRSVFPFLFPPLAC